MDFSLLRLVDGLVRGMMVKGITLFLKFLMIFFSVSCPLRGWYLLLPCVFEEASLPLLYRIALSLLAVSPHVGVTSFILIMLYYYAYLLIPIFY